MPNVAQRNLADDETKGRPLVKSPIEDVTRFLEDVKTNPDAYDGVRRQIQGFLREEGRVVEEAVDVLLELRDMMEEGEEEEWRVSAVREIEWIEKDLIAARRGITDTIDWKLRSLGARK